MAYRVISSRDGVDLDLSFPTVSWAIVAAKQDEDAGRSPMIVDENGFLMNLADFRVKHLER
jgi:hypothetical protein